ncbi:MAG TPA: NADH:flavin oxidoreductase [Anaerolineae bacterium]
MSFHRVAADKTAAAFKSHLAAAGVDLPFDETVTAAPSGALAQPHAVPGLDGRTIGNRFAILPMEGWDGMPDGRPSELTFRRWEHFGRSGAKLIWGGEAVAVRHDGRANPNQLMIGAATLSDLARLRATLVETHEQVTGRADDLFVGVQLTHSGRFCRPNDKKRLEPFILYHHPILDRKFGTPADYPLMTDDQIKRLIDDFIAAAGRARQAGFDFVDLKHCHGYLGHEFLSAVDRPGPYGGSLENRTRFLREIVAGIRASVPGLQIGVRFSAFDLVPFRPDAAGVGEPEPFAGTTYPYAFGGDGTGLGIDLAEPKQFLDILAGLDIRLVCITAASPYYNPHLMRPALFPPSDGYLPCEDPLAGVGRELWAAAELKAHRPDLTFVGSGYTYLQEWLPNVAQAMVRLNHIDFVGLGRMVLSYPDLPADVLAGRPLQRKHLCRTFSDCTTAPRNGLVSGCYPLDSFYGERPEAGRLAALKAKK